MGSTYYVDQLKLGIPLETSYGGTNQTSYNEGDILYGNSSNNLSTLPIGSIGHVLTSNGITPYWSSGITGSTGRTGDTGPTGRTGDTGPSTTGTFFYSAIITSPGPVIADNSPILFPAASPPTLSTLPYNSVNGRVSLVPGFYQVSFGVATSNTQALFGISINGSIPVQQHCTATRRDFIFGSSECIIEITTIGSYITMNNISGGNRTLRSISTLGNTLSAYLRVVRLS